MSSTGIKLSNFHFRASAFATAPPAYTYKTGFHSIYQMTWLTQFKKKTFIATSFSFFKRSVFHFMSYFTMSFFFSFYAIPMPFIPYYTMLFFHFKTILYFYTRFFAFNALPSYVVYVFLLYYTILFFYILSHTILCRFFKFMPYMKT